MGSINKLLKKQLKGQNLSQLTSLLGLPKGLLHRLVKENKNPSLNNLDSLIRLAKYLDLSLDELLTGDIPEEYISTIEIEIEGERFLMEVQKIKKI